MSGSLSKPKLAAKKHAKPVRTQRVGVLGGSFDPCLLSLEGRGPRCNAERIGEEIQKEYSRLGILECHPS